MIVRNARMLFNKTGQGFTTTRITIPVPWTKALNFEKEDRQGHLILDAENKRIIIKKGVVNMIKIINRNFKRVDSWVDYELENGILLYEEDWNGEIYRTGYDEKKEKDSQYSYRPIFKYEIENLDICEIEENTDEWYDAMTVIGFEEF